MSEKHVIDPSEAIDDQYVLDKYNSKIAYYWGASRSNKNSYKQYRAWTVILGSLVTLVSSISAAEFVQNPPWLRVLFAVGTPIIAATLTVINGLGQNFHWGATWRDMVLNGTRLEKERDRFLATKPEDRDLVKELDRLNGIVLDETKNFSQRVLDSEVKPTKEQNNNG
jgi:hypothetical protein